MFDHKQPFKFNKSEVLIDVVILFCVTYTSVSLGQYLAMLVN